MIPKPGKKETRPLGIPTILDRLVQEVIRIILNPIFEAKFKNTSHGFRVGRSCHTAIQIINVSFRDSKWIIEGDISKYFDTINPEILIDLIKKAGITDKLITNIIRTGLKYKIIHGNKILEPLMVTPQGGILSPLLSNIYLHELDCYMEKLRDEFEGKIKTPRVNPAEGPLSSYAAQGPEASGARRSRAPLAYTKLADNKIAYLARKQRIPYRMPNDPEYKNLKYNRYADDFIVGINGSRKDAELIKEKIRIFLKEKLKIELNEEKTKITSMAKTFTYLGYKFARATIITRMKNNIKNKTAYAYKKRVKVMFTRADTSKTIQRLQQRGFCDGSGWPTPPFRYLQEPQSMINQRVNYILRGLCE